MAITHGQAINELKLGQFVRLEKISPAGTLEARRITTGVMLYWRVTANGKTSRLTIGRCDPKAPPKSIKPTGRGHSVQAAIRAAEAMAMQHVDHLDSGGYPALKRQQQFERVQAAAAEQAAMKYTLAGLMDDYANHLMDLGRQAHRDVRSITRLHIEAAWPDIAHLPANQVTAENVADMMRRLLETGSGRTANKLRSYVRAAYQVARDARSKPSIPVRFKAYQVTMNPAADTAPDERSNRADKNPLSEAELRVYWQAIEGLPGAQGAVLRLHLLTGGQRIEQLVNLLAQNVSATSITLFDAKGRPGHDARPHVVPLLDQAVADLRFLESRRVVKPAGGLRLPAAGGPYVISSDGGQTHVASTTLSRWAAEVAATAGIDNFQAKRIRSGIETLLAAHGISVEIRGRLQSHPRRWPARCARAGSRTRATSGCAQTIAAAQTPAR